MKLKIILTSLILFLSFNLYSQVYYYESHLRKVIDENNIPDYTYSKFKFYLDLNSKILKTDFIGEDNEYKIITYYKLCNDSSIYFEVEGINNKKIKYIISINNESKLITYYINRDITINYIINFYNKLE